MRTPSQIGNAIADDIERLGHWQGSDAEDADRGTGVCVVTSFSYPLRGKSDITERDLFLTALYHRIGHDVPLGDGEYGTGVVASGPAMRWNDETPTAEVLATLRSLEDPMTDVSLDQNCGLCGRSACDGGCSDFTAHCEGY